MNWSKIFLIIVLMPCVIQGMELPENDDQESFLQSIYEDMLHDFNQISSSSHNVDPFVQTYMDTQKVTLDEFTYQMMLNDEIERKRPFAKENPQAFNLMQSVAEKLKNDQSFDLEKNPYFNAMYCDKDVQQCLKAAFQKTKEMNDAWIRFRYNAAQAAYQQVVKRTEIKIEEGLPEESPEEAHRKFFEANKDIDPFKNENIEELRLLKHALYFNIFLQRTTIKKLYSILQDEYKVGVNYRKRHITDNNAEKKKCKTTG